MQHLAFIARSTSPASRRTSILCAPDNLPHAAGGGRGTGATFCRFVGDSSGDSSPSSWGLGCPVENLEEMRLEAYCAERRKQLDGHKL